MTKQQQPEAIAHGLQTVAEIRAARLKLFERQRALQAEGAANYAAMKAGSPPTQPLTDHQRRVAGHVQLLMNGSTPASLLAPAVSRDDQIRAELDAIAFVDRDLGRQEEIAREREAGAWVTEHADQWRALCHDIVLTAVRLAALEGSAREALSYLQVPGVKGLAMAATIGSGYSLLGIGDPLREMIEAALSENVVTQAEIRKAEKC